MCLLLLLLYFFISSSCIYCVGIFFICFLLVVGWVLFASKFTSEVFAEEKSVSAERDDLLAARLNGSTDAALGSSL